MKTMSSFVRYQLIASLTTVSVVLAWGQGTITFDAHPLFSGQSYNELSMWFRVLAPFPEVPTDGMGVAPAITAPSNIPYNGTPYMIFQRNYSPDDYVTFSLTNGDSFGLTSVQLADPNSPSLTPVPISFIGFLPSGSIVTNTFTTPGNGATNLLAYVFNSDFASGLTGVEIQSTRWAMDNLVFTVPEPSIGSLIGVGLLIWGGWKRRKRGMT